MERGGDHNIRQRRLDVCSILNEIRNSPRRDISAKLADGDIHANLLVTSLRPQGRPSIWSITQEVRAAVSPVLGHTSHPFNSFTTVWISGCSICCGYVSANSVAPPAVLSKIGRAVNVENEISPLLPTILVISLLSAVVKHQAPTPCTPDSNWNVPVTMSSA